MHDIPEGVQVMKPNYILCNSMTPLKAGNLSSGYLTLLGMFRRNDSEPEWCAATFFCGRIWHCRLPNSPPRNAENHFRKGGTDISETASRPV